MRKIRDDLAVHIETVLLDYSNHAHNRERLLGIEPQVFPDGIVAGPKTLGEFLVDNCRLRHVLSVVLREKAALAQGNLHGSKIIRARYAYVDLQLLPGRRCVALNVDASPTHRAG